MSWWSSDTCLQFVQRSNETDYVEFVKSMHCRATVGKVSGRQEVELNKRCLERVGSIAHEIGHALGFWHEHQRPDRDEFVDVNYGNIPAESQHLFYPFTDREIDSLQVGYDYGSIMHYHPYAFAINKSEPTIRLLNDYDGEVGQRDHISDSDRAQIRVYYCLEEESGESPIPSLIMPSLSSPQSPTSLVFSVSQETVPSSYFLISSQLLPTMHLQPITSHSVSASSLASVSSIVPVSSIATVLSIASVSSISSVSSLASISTIAPVSPFVSLSLQPVINISALPSPSSPSQPIALSTSLYASSSSQSITETNPLVKPSPSPSFKPTLSIITVGTKFGMRLFNSSLWMMCKTSSKKMTCRLDGCPSKHGLNEQQCQVSTYMFEKIFNTVNSNITTEKDLVILKPSIDTSSFIHCKGKSVCRYSKSECGMPGHFDVQTCHYNILTVWLVQGSNSTHPLVTLQFVDQDEKTVWLGCNRERKMRCKRFSCSIDQPCTPDTFELVELL